MISFLKKFNQTKQGLKKETSERSCERKVFESRARLSIPPSLARSLQPIQIQVVFSFRKFCKIFKIFSSHRIFRRIYKILNINKK